MIQKEILFFGQLRVLACDAKCDKAWGINNRPKTQLSDDPDDYEFHSDEELDTAPVDPGTYEGADGKPTSEQERLNRWCVRECERSTVIKPGEAIELPDFSIRHKNIP